MPLHLLGKKSWNVYNADNIAKVKQDEADAAALEAAEEQRHQEADAERRIRILRGEHIEPPAAPEQERDEERSNTRNKSGWERKRRRLAGENDTDRDIRFAKEDRALATDKLEKTATSKKSLDIPLTDAQGNINLFPSVPNVQQSSTNAEFEAEKEKKRKEYEDQYTMRFSNAAGFGQAVGQKPWYQSSKTAENPGIQQDMPSKDVWGNEDPRRRERERLRTAADDPLAMMQRGAAAVRQVEKERISWREEKSREIEALDNEHVRREKRKRQRRQDDLEGFSLDRDRSDNSHSKHHRRRRRRRDAEMEARHSQRHDRDEKTYRRSHPPRHNRSPG